MLRILPPTFKPVLQQIKLFVEGCVKLSQKVEFYFLQQLLLRSKWRIFRVWRDLRVVLSNQKSVSTQLAAT